MQPAYIKGAISAMVLNILLVVGIAIAVTVLLFRAEPEQSSPAQTSSPVTPPRPSGTVANPQPSTPSQPPSTIVATDPASQEEIETLRAQLEEESQRLEAVRRQEELVEKIRKDQAREVAEAASTDTAVQASTNEVETASTTALDTPAGQTPSAATDNPQTAETPAAGSAAEAPKRRLITPMGFPE